MNTYGQNVETLLTENNGISLPKALAVYDKHLYYLDPRYEKLERVMIEEPINTEVIMDNEADLKSFVIFRNRQSNFLQTSYIFIFILYC